MYSPIHDCKLELQGAALKATPARVALLQILEQSTQPLSVSSIADKLKEKHLKTNPATLFRIVDKLTTQGLVKRIHFFDDKTRYEISTTEDHHHFVCESCREIQDISDCSIETLEEKIKKKGLLIKYHSLEFFGLCKSCQL